MNLISKQVFAKTKPDLIYRIKTEKFGNGVTIHTPQVKESGLFNAWNQIVKIYDKYEIYHFPGDHGLTVKDCEQHIKEYQKQEEEKFNQVNSVVDYVELTI